MLRDGQMKRHKAILWYNTDKTIEDSSFQTKENTGMDFQELISDFAERHGIASLAAEDNAAALDVDGILVTLVSAGDTLSVTADIGEPPVDGRADFAELLLEANLQSEAFFSKDP